MPVYLEKQSGRMRKGWWGGGVGGARGGVGAHRFSLAQDTIFSAFSDISETPLRVMAKAMKKAAAPAAPAMKKGRRRAMKARKAMK